VLTYEQAKTAVSKNLTRSLEEQGKTPYWLMKELEVSAGTIYPIVRGEKQPLIGFASRIAEALNISIDDLIQEKIPNRRK